MNRCFPSSRPNTFRVLCGLALAFACAFSGVKPARCQTAAARASSEIMTVIVSPFTNKDKFGTGGPELARWATDAVAVELASSARYEVLKPTEVNKAAAERGYRPPFGTDELRRTAADLGASAIVSGEIAYVRPNTRKGVLESAEVGLLVRVEDVNFGEPVNGSAQIAVAPVKSGNSDFDALTRDAVSKAAMMSVRDLIATTLPEGTVTLTQTSISGNTTVLINRGSRDGIQSGMEMLVLRNGMRVGKIRVGTVFATDSEATMIETTQGVRPMDRVRATFAMPAFVFRK